MAQVRWFDKAIHLVRQMCDSPDAAGQSRLIIRLASRPFRKWTLDMDGRKRRINEKNCRLEISCQMGSSVAIAYFTVRFAWKRQYCWLPYGFMQIHWNILFSLAALASFSQRETLLSPFRLAKAARSDTITLPDVTDLNGYWLSPMTAPSLSWVLNRVSFTPMIYFLFDLK